VQVERTNWPGTIALEGGGPFSANDELDRRLLAELGTDRVVVLPTADAFEEPAALVADAMGWGERLGVVVEALMVLQRHDADDEGAAEVVRAARAVWFVGDSSMHLRSAMRDTAVWRAVEGVVAAGGLVVGVGSAATALGDPMLDQRGGALTLGLGLLRGVAVVPGAEGRSHDRQVRTRELADTPLVELPTGAALVWRSGTFELVGDAVVTHGELP
jgi:cyanophycinase